MDFASEHIVHILLILFTGISAGLCFTWYNVITPGIGNLDDLGYLRAFQQMNRSILNPYFIIVFFGPILLGLINWYQLKDTSQLFILVLILSIACYFLGVILVTIFGNVPLNDLLDKTDLKKTSVIEIQQLRDRFEVRWNRLHLIRTISSLLSFLLLIITLFIKR